MSEVLLIGHSSFLLVVYLTADALLPSRTLAAAEQEILLAFLTSINTCGVMEMWVSHECLMNTF